MAFVEDNATKSSIRYIENHVSFCAKPKEVDPIKPISLRQISVSIALKIKLTTAYYNKQNKGIDDCNTFFFN